MTAKSRARSSSRAKPEVTFTTAAESLESILGGSVRREIRGELTRFKDLGQALQRLRDGMRSNVFKIGEGSVSLQRIVRKLDERCREEGFHVLHDWDGKANRLNEDTIPVDVVSYGIRIVGSEPNVEVVPSILLDYYFLYLLSLLSMRVGDEGDVDSDLDRVTALLMELQGPMGSGQRFAENAETLVLLATSHFEADEGAYERLLASVRRWSPAHQKNLALAHAAILSSHLRFGFEATYGRDVSKMRKDNVADYPWLCFALTTLLEAYDRMERQSLEGVERERIVESLLNGLTPDPRAFVGELPSLLSDYAEERSLFLELFQRHRSRLLPELERHRPSKNAYSPISFYFNFLHNVLKAMVVDAFLRRKPWRLSMNDLLTGVGEADGDESRESLATTLMGYARSHPDRIGGRLTPVIVYDPRSGSRAVTETLQRIQS